LNNSKYLTSPTLGGRGQGVALTGLVMGGVMEARL
jgi:hypothetical protein